MPTKTMNYSDDPVNNVKNMPIKHNALKKPNRDKTICCILWLVGSFI